MRLPYKKNLIPFAKSLRKNATPQENHLWYDFLRGYKPRFQRQKAIDGYIADFYCHEARLIIELDGSQHYSIPGKQADAVRDGYLREQGLTVLRYSNSDVDRDFPGVCGDILAHLQNS